MPLLLLVPLAGLALGGGIKLAGDGIEDVSKASVNGVFVAGAALGIYLLAKKHKVI